MKSENKDMNKDENRTRKMEKIKIFKIYKV